MGSESLVHTAQITIAGKDYEIAVFLRADGLHLAQTVFSPGDVIINDGHSLGEVLERHRRVLPLAVDSRQVLRELRSS